MKRIFAGLLIAASILVSAPVAWAGDLAVILANEYYQTHPRVVESKIVAQLDRDFRDAGFDVLRLPNTRSDYTEGEAGTLLRRMIQADRLVVVMSGHVVRANGEGWLLNTDAGRVNALTIGHQALPIRSFLSVAADKPGDAVIAIAETGEELDIGLGVRIGYEPEDIAQGVTVLTGSARQISDFIARDLLVPGRSMARAVRNAPNGFRALGYIPGSRAFLPAREAGFDPQTRELSAWQSAQSVNTVHAYEAFLNQYPHGQFAQEARRRLDDLRLTPQDRARIAEEALDLSRNQRRAIQRNLTLLGYDTFGVDGILGRRSRTAIAQWQRDNGLNATAYLTANQISRIDVAAATRAEELRREAERRRQEEEQRDRRFWQQTGASGSEEGLHAYLQRYPDGLYSEIAVESLRAIEREQRRLAQKAERDAWDRAVLAGTLDSYQGYLNEYPQGRFADEARARLQSLANPETPRDVVDAAKAEEEGMNLNAITRKLIEAGLRNNNLAPGQIDGRFTRETRRALRQFQRAHSLPVTGYVTRDTIVLLLASSID